MNGGNNDDSPAALGERLRAARTEAGISLGELANRVGVSSSQVSQIERGKSMPSVATLYSIVRVLDASMDDLFFRTGGGREHPGDGTGPVKRGDDRKTIYLASGVRWERLTHAPDPDVDFQIATYEPGSESCPADALTVHGGHEYGFVVSGTLRITVGDETFDLGPGDAISFSSTEPHRLFNVGSEPAQAVWWVSGRDHDARVSASG